jgi:DNA-directed RNA polymerase subunit omega
MKMLYPPVADLLKNVQSRYLLVNVVAQRARQIAEEAEELGEELTEKPVTLAIREVADEKLDGSLKEEYMH